jgi:hypothetical protein
MPASALLSLSLLFAAPVVCPPQEGQIRWDGFSIKTGPGNAYELRGTLWDRDTSNGPSAGDLVRIDEVLKNGRATGAEALWFLMGPGLAADFGKRFRETQGSLTSACESRVEIGKDMPTFKTADALTGYLSELTGGAVPRTSPEDDLRAQMNGWADEICKQGKHVEEKDLEKLLVTRAGSPKGLSKPVVRGVAHEVAAKYAFACTRVEGKFTFDK